MRASLFWFSDEQWLKIEPLLPERRPGPKPRNNRRVLSGIMHVLKTGCRWQDCPPEYGPYTTVYNRFNRWSGRGIWQQIFESAAQAPESPGEVALDSTHAKAHRCAGGGKGGPRNRRSASPGVAATASFTRWSINCAVPGSLFSRPATPPTARSGPNASAWLPASTSFWATKRMTAIHSANP